MRNQILDNQFQESIQEILNQIYVEIHKFENLEEFLIYSYQVGLTANTIDKFGISSLLQCKNLKKLTLGLSSNMLGNEGIIFLGTQVSQLVQLEILGLVLENTNIQNGTLDLFGQSLLGLINLRDLSLFFYHNQISEEGVNSLMKSLQFLKLNNLHLSLSKNDVKDGGLNKFSQYIPAFKELKSLVLLIKIDDNREWFSQNSFAEEINKNKNITKMELELNEKDNFEEIEMTDLGNQLNKCQNLKKLKIIFYKVFLNAHKILKCYNVSHLTISFQARNENLQEKFKDFFQETLSQTYAEISKFENLEELFLYQYQLGLTTNSINQLGNSLLQCKNLKKLTLGLSTNMQGNEDVVFLATCLSKLVQLKLLGLILESNNIQNDTLDLLGQSLFSLINLRDLTLLLYQNQISEEGIDSLMKSLQHLKLNNLHLSFSKNDIKDGGLNKFSQYIPIFKELQSLVLLINDTQISEISLLKLIQQIKICKNIKILKIEANNIYTIESLSLMTNLLKTLIQLNCLRFFTNEVYKKRNQKVQILIQKKLVRLVNKPEIVM
ncbi:hypothetical protein ABPG74_009933 [Tetrahymena malaccensis]